MGGMKPFDFSAVDSALRAVDLAGMDAMREASRRVIEELNIPAVLEMQRSLAEVQKQAMSPVITSVTAAMASYMASDRVGGLLRGSDELASKVLGAESPMARVMESFAQASRRMTEAIEAATRYQLPTVVTQGHWAQKVLDAATREVVPPAAERLFEDLTSLTESISTDEVGDLDECADQFALLTEKVSKVPEEQKTTAWYQTLVNFIFTVLTLYIFGAELLDATETYVDSPETVRHIHEVVFESEEEPPVTPSPSPSSTSNPVEPEGKD